MSTFRIFGCVFWLILDRFRLLLICNFFSMLLALPIVTLPLALAGMLHVCDKLITIRHASLGDYWTGVRKFSMRVYAWSAAGLILCLWCIASSLFYATLPPLLRAVGNIFTLLVMVAIGIFGAMILPLFVKNQGWKEDARRTAQWILKQPGKVFTFLIATFSMEGFLFLTGAGFLVAGCVFPPLATLLFWKNYRHLRFGDAPYREERTWRDFLVPSQLLK